MLSYDNDLPLPVLVPMKTSFPSAKLWNFHLVDSKCFQIKFITNKFVFTGRCHFQLSNIRITKRFWLAGDDDYLRGATSINHQVALPANFKMYSRSAKGGEKGDPNRNPWLAKMGKIWPSYKYKSFILSRAYINNKHKLWAFLYFCRRNVRSCKIVMQWLHKIGTDNWRCCWKMAKFKES